MLTRLQLIPTGQRSHEDLDRTPEVAVGTASVEFRGFDQHLIRPARLWTSLLASVGVHGVAFTSAWIIMQILPTAGTAPPLRYRVTYEPITTFLQIRPAVEVRRPVQRAAAAAGGAAESSASAEKTLHAPVEQARAEGGGTPRILRVAHDPDRRLRGQAVRGRVEVRQARVGLEHRPDRRIHGLARQLRQGPTGSAVGLCGRDT